MKMKADILNEIYEHVKRGEKAALVLLTKNRGSAPGEEGSVMAVFQNGEISGTVGGGAIEFDIIRRTRENMETGEDFSFDYNLSERGELKMACGGQSQGFVKFFFPPKQLIIFGAGHVGQKLARVASLSGYRVIVADERPAFSAEKDLAMIDRFVTGSLDEMMAQLSFEPQNTFVVICTPGHRQDEAVLERVLVQPTRYVGMIGSRNKVLTIHQQLKEKGFSEKDLNRLYAPIGLDVDNGSVEEIAISILSEMLMMKNGTDGRSNRLKWQEKMQKKD